MAASEGKLMQKVLQMWDIECPKKKALMGADTLGWRVFLRAMAL